MDKTLKKALIVGAGEAGNELLLELRKISMGYRVVGFIDDDPKKQREKINNLLVLGKIDNMGFLIKKHDIDEVLIAIPSASGQTIRRILENTRGLRVKFKIVPRTLETIKGKVQLSKLRDVQLTDLLGRAIIKSEQPVLLKEFKGKKILVTGAAGSIGSELCRQLIQFDPRFLVAFDWWENGLFELGMNLGELTSVDSFECVLGSIQDINRLRDVILRLRPNIIFHTAAFKHVALVQENPLEAIKNNIFGTENVAKVAYEGDVKKFIYISSDKAANPGNIMGATKFIGENIIRVFNSRGKTKYAAVRFGNVLESSGSILPIFRKQITSGGPVTVTDPRMTRFMMTIPEAVQLVLNASILTQGGEVFMLYMGEQIKIDEVARFMIQLAGFIPDRDIAIKYIGARPGEKLEEQLVSSDEYVEGTTNNMIFKVNRSIDNIGLRDLDELRVALEKNDSKKSFLVLKKFAPNLKFHE